MGPTGSAQMVARIRLAAKNLNFQVQQALLAETELMATRVKGRTPVDTGTLRAGIHVVGPEVQGQTMMTAIVAGGPSSPYAIFVHEDLTKHHPTGGPKFIESVLDEERGNILPRIAARVQMSSL